jgi:hypothetical protein
MLLRKMNKLQRPCQVLSELDKSIKKLKINCIGLIFTIFDHPVNAKPTELRIFVRKRVAKSYGTYHDLVLQE